MNTGCSFNNNNSSLKQQQQHVLGHVKEEKRTTRPQTTEKRCNKQCGKLNNRPLCDVYKRGATALFWPLLRCFKSIDETRHWGTLEAWWTDQRDPEEDIRHPVQLQVLLAACARVLQCQKRLEVLLKECHGKRLLGGHTRVQQLCVEQKRAQVVQEIVRSGADNVSRLWNQPTNCCWFAPALVL